MPLFNKTENNAARHQQNLAATGTTTGAVSGTAAPRHGHVGVGSNLPGPTPSTAGPHKHDIMNKLDPTVDSQHGGAQVLRPETQQRTAAAGVSDTAPTHRSKGPLSSNNTYGTQPQHNSRLANMLDPRVDSTQANAGTMHGGGVASTGAAVPRNVHEGTYGPHSSRVANAADPRVDSDADRRAAAGMPASHAHGTFPPGVAGPAPTTAGPHRHDILNKLDPAVDHKLTGVNAGNGRQAF